MEINISTLTCLQVIGSWPVLLELGALQGRFPDGSVGCAEGLLLRSSLFRLNSKKFDL